MASWTCKHGTEKITAEKLHHTSGADDILCPFFRAHNREKIRCQDILPETQHVTIQFRDKSEKEYHQRTFCEAEYKKCWIYWLAMRAQWDDEE